MSHGNKFLPLVAFSLVVIERQEEGKRSEYVLVHEKGERGWWLPGGGVDHGETLGDAAIRETKEEAGIDIELVGVLRMEVSNKGGRLRVIYKGRPCDPNQPLKTIPDQETKGARWCTLPTCEALANGGIDPFGPNIKETNLYLRGPEPLNWFTFLEARAKAQGGLATVAPLDFLVSRNLGEPLPLGPTSGRCVSHTFQWTEVIIVDNESNPSRFLLKLDKERNIWRFPGGRVKSPKVGFELTARSALTADYELKGIVQIQHFILRREDDSMGGREQQKNRGQLACLRVCYYAAPRVQAKGLLLPSNDANEWRWASLKELSSLAPATGSGVEDDTGFPPFDSPAAARRVLEGKIEPLGIICDNEREPPLGSN